MEGLQIGKEFLEKKDTTETTTETTEVASTETTTTATAETTEEQVNTEQTATTTTETASTENTTETVEDEYNEDFQQKVIDFMTKKSGKQFTSVEDLWKEQEPKEIVKEVNPYEKLKPEVQGFLTYHNETGRSYEDYQKLNQDVSTISDIDLAREKVLKDSGMDLSPEDVDAFLEKSLNIDLSDINDLDTTDKIALKTFTNSFREEKKLEQEKYKQPIAQTTTTVDDADMVTLEGGQKIPKAEYENLLSQRTEYLGSVQKASDSINAFNFQVKVDDKGSEKTLAFGFDLSAEDKHNMVSMAQDVNKTIGDLFRTENGFDHKGFLEALHFVNPKTREKTISSIIHKVRAQTTEDVLKEIDNVNLGNHDNIDKGSKAERVVPIGPTDGFGISFLKK